MPRFAHLEPLDRMIKRLQVASIMWGAREEESWADFYASLPGGHETRMRKLMQRYLFSAGQHAKIERLLAKAVRERAAREADLVPQVERDRLQAAIEHAGAIGDESQGWGEWLFLHPQGAWGGQRPKG